MTGPCSDQACRPMLRHCCLTTGEHAGRKGRPRQDSNLRHRLRRPLWFVQTVLPVRPCAPEQAFPSRGFTTVFSVAPIDCQFGLPRSAGRWRATSQRVAIPDLEQRPSHLDEGAGAPLQHRLALGQDAD